MIAYQTSLNNRAMLLNSNSGNFFEFVRYEDRDRADADRYWVGTLEANRDYVPVISNANGLWAYALGDVVRFSETSPAMLEVVGRTAEILSLYREGLRGELARQSLDTACRQSGAASFPVSCELFARRCARSAQPRVVHRVCPRTRKCVGLRTGAR